MDFYLHLSSAIHTHPVVCCTGVVSRVLLISKQVIWLSVLVFYRLSSHRL